MGFFSRLKWLFTGKGEAPAGYTATPGVVKRHETAGGRGSGSQRDRGPRDRHPRGDSRGHRNPRGNRDSRERGERPSRSGLNRDGGERGGRYSNDQPQGARRGRSQGDFGRRDHRDSDIPRQIIRPAGGPSSTMMPAQSSAPETVSAPPRPVPSGPEKVGVVSQYHDDTRTASIKVEKGQVCSGDWIEIQGHISTLRQKVEALQMDSQPINQATEGQEVSIKVIRPVKSGDAVIRLRG